MISPTRSVAAVLLGAVIVWGASGCTGSATVHSMPMLRQNFLASEAPAQRVDVDEAYYWIDEQKRVNVALRRHVPSLLGKAFEYDWRLSLMFEDLPAGSEKLYRLGANSARMLTSYGAAHTRVASLMGVAVLHAPRNGVMTGRFHVNLRQQAFTVLTGWAPPLNGAPMVVMAGKFEAVYDPVRGKAIRERTEADGLGRNWRGGAYLLYPATTQSTSQPILLRPASVPSTGPAGR